MFFFSSPFELASSLLWLCCRLCCCCCSCRSSCYGSTLVISHTFGINSLIILFDCIFIHNISVQETQSTIRHGWTPPPPAAAAMERASGSCCRRHPCFVLCGQPGAAAAAGPGQSQPARSAEVVALPGQPTRASERASLSRLETSSPSSLPLPCE